MNLFTKISGTLYKFAGKPLELNSIGQRTTKNLAQGSIVKEPDGNLYRLNGNYTTVAGWEKLILY